MDVKDKIVTALSQAFKVDHVRIEDDDGISGYAVSPNFQGMSAVERQTKIDDVFRGSKFSHEERSRILMIAALTPEEFAAVGVRIRITKVKQMANAVEISLHGSYSDAEYVRGAFKGQKGVKTTDPRPVPGAVGVLMSFRAMGSAANPLTRDKAIRVLQQDGYIEVEVDA